MKKILIIAVAAAVLLGVGTLSVKHYNKYQINKKHSEATQLQVARDQLHQVQVGAQAQEAKLQQAYTNARLECEKGLAAYGKLPLAIQKVTPQPVCGTAVIQ